MVESSPKIRRGNQSLHHFYEVLAVFGQTPHVIRLVWHAYPLVSVVLPILTLISAPLPMFNLYCWKKIIDGVTLCLQGETYQGRNLILLFLVLSFIFLLLQKGLDCLTHFLERLLNLRLTKHIQTMILKQSTILDIEFFETPDFYDKLQRAQQESGIRPYTILSSLITGGRQCLTLCSYLAVLFMLSWWIIPCLLLVTIPGLVLQAKFGRLAWTIRRRRTPEERRVHYYQHLMTSNYEAKEIRLFQLTNYLMSQWGTLFEQFYHQDRKLTAKQSLAEFGTLVLQTVAATGFCAFAIYRTVVDPLVSIGSLFMYTQAMESAIGSIMAIFHAIAALYENNLYLSNFFEYLSQKPLVSALGRPTSVPTKIRHGICFESVSFHYPNNEREVLKDVSFEIEAGERIAIVGENGSGKTTLIKLLARLYDPQEGRITVDGIDLREFDPTEWQRQIGIIFQDFIRYWVTARENIGFGQLEYMDNMHKIRVAAESSGAAKCIERLEGKWGAILGKLFEEGQELSIGEWQKVALARAFLRNAQVLVLDEPTASLDANHEFEIFTKFDEFTKGKTTALISHRFSTVKMADRILVLEEGQLVESGKHDELIALNNKYAWLFNRQAAAYR